MGRWRDVLCSNARTNAVLTDSRHAPLRGRL